MMMMTGATRGTIPAGLPVVTIYYYCTVEYASAERRGRVNCDMHETDKKEKITYVTNKND